MYNHNMPRVSVLMPCYNVRETVVETLQSLVSQSERDIEIVAVDDGSEDDTLQVLENWSQKDRRINVISRGHEGVIPTLNHGLTVCKAEYIARMDADDLAQEERLALQAQYLDDHPEIALVSSLVSGFPKEAVGKGFQIYLNWLNSLLTEEDIHREIFIESPVVHPSVMYRKSVIEDLGGYQDYGWPEDYDLWMRMYINGNRFAKIPQVLVQWREHEKRLTRTDDRYSMVNMLRLKAHYLMHGPLIDRDAIILWGAGSIGGRVGKLLKEAGFPVDAYIDVDPKRIGSTRHGHTIYAADDVPSLWSAHKTPVILAAVGVRGARQLIRNQLVEMGFQEGVDWWAVA